MACFLQYRYLKRTNTQRIFTIKKQNKFKFLSTISKKKNLIKNTFNTKFFFHFRSRNKKKFSWKYNYLLYIARKKKILFRKIFNKKKFFFRFAGRSRLRFNLSFAFSWLNKKKFYFYLFNVRYNPLYKNYYWRRVKRTNWQKFFRVNKKTNWTLTNVKYLIFHKSVLKWPFFLDNAKRFRKQQKRSAWFFSLLKHLLNCPSRAKHNFKIKYYLNRMFKSVYFFKNLFLLRQLRLGKVKTRVGTQDNLFVGFFLTSVGIYICNVGMAVTTRWAKTFIKSRFINVTYALKI